MFSRLRPVGLALRALSRRERERGQKMKLDIVTLEVIRNVLPEIANEMSYVLQRTSHNMMIYEVRDESERLLDSLRHARIGRMSAASAPALEPPMRSIRGWRACSSIRSSCMKQAGWMKRYGA